MDEHDTAGPTGSDGPKAAFAGRFFRELECGRPQASWTWSEKLALTCRILFDEDHESGLAGQITCRGPLARTVWTTPFEAGFSEISASTLVLVDDDLNVVRGVGAANPASRFHFALYDRRPDVNCIIHTHPPHASALAMTGERFVAAHMDAMALFDDCAYLAQWPGVPISDQEGPLISVALGDKRAILLANHGILTVGASIEEAAYLAVTFERACRLQLLARTLGAIQEVEPDLGREAHAFMTKAPLVEAVFAYWARRAARRHPDCLD
jgi:L-fuculose-phosphate aldolase